MSRGLHLGVDFTNMTVELLTELLPWNQSISQSQGSVQLQPNGNFLVGCVPVPNRVIYVCLTLYLVSRFGQLPWTGEYSPDGDLLWTTQFGVGDVESCMSFKRS